MKIKQVESIVKSSKQIHILNALDCQWLGDGTAFYPLYDMPELTESTIYTMLDIPEDNRSKYVYTERNFPSEYSLNDFEIDETVIMRDMFDVVVRGAIVEPLKTPRGLIFIDTKYLKPFTGDSYELYERIGKSGEIYIVVKCGFTLRGIISPCEILDEKFMTALETLTKEARNKYVVSSAPKCEQISIDDEEGISE